MALSLEAPAPFPTIDLMGVSLHALSEVQCVDHVAHEIENGRGGWIVTPNLDHLRRLVDEPSYRDLCAGSTLRVADGMPLVWASRLQRTPLPARVAGSDLICSLSAEAGRRAWRVYFLGGDPGTAMQAAEILARRHSGLCVVGCECPPPGFDADPAAMRRLAADLVAAQPDLVFVALGSPKQERLIRDLDALLPRAWWIGIGISFSFVTGDVRRAPAWMQRMGLEWIHRLAQEPRRLARRYLIDGLPFAVRLFTTSARRRWAGSLPRS